METTDVVTSHNPNRRAAVACAALLIAVVTLATGCGKGQQGPATSTTTTTTTTTTTSPSEAPPSPTEKTINPTGGNLFTPGVTAPGAATVQPGSHPGINGVP
jgi:hypothetical protein